MVNLLMAIFLNDDTNTTEQRKYVRLNATGMDISISDKVGFSSGTLKDISRFGVCIVDLPRPLQSDNDGITAVITASEKRFKLRLKPQWEKQDGLMMVMGAIIDDVPLDWTEMVMELKYHQNSSPVKSPSVVVRKRGLSKTLRRGVIVVKRASDKMN